MLARIAREAAGSRACPTARSALVAGGGREELTELAQLEGIVDLIIPRGGEGLKKAISAVARVPVIYAAAGNCHVYVDATADLAMAERIIVNAKVQRPGMCNSAETLLVHSAVAAAFLPAARSRRCAPRASSCAATSACARSIRRSPRPRTPTGARSSSR